MDFKKALVNIKAFLPEDKEILKIIEVCDLEPTDDWKVWTDHYGHNLIVKNNKTVTSKTKNPIIKFPIKIKDIYFKSSARQIAYNSKWVMISLAESVQDSIPNICFIWFLGVDNRLRLLCYMRNSWVENKMPLSSGVHTLRLIVKNFEVSGYKVIIGSRYINGPYEGNVVKSWVSQWPPPSNMQLDILLTNRTIGQKILKDCGVLND